MPAPTANARGTDLSRYAWADYLHCMDGLPDAALDLPARPAARPQAAHIGWGVVAALVVAIASTYVSELKFPPFTDAAGRHPIEPVMIAIVMGMLIANILRLPKALVPGLKFTAKKLLPLAIIMLGARLNFMMIVKVGALGVVLSIGTIVVGLGIFLLFVRLGWVKQKLGLLLGIGTAICGGTAIVAAAPIVEAEDDDVTFGVATVTLVGMLAMFVLPIAGHAMHLSDKAFGTWAGLSIHQTPQVVAAGFAYAKSAGETATIVKLARVSLLAPVLLLVSFQLAKKRSREGIEAAPKRSARWLSMFPTFVIGFLALALLRTMGWLPDLTIHLGKEAVWGAGSHEVSLINLCDMVSKFLIVTAMAAVGLETSVSSLRQTGMRPLLLGLSASVVISGLILGVLLLAHI
jgi:uncharacterized integral membrane protein (TIGR00698 family)